MSFKIMLHGDYKTGMVAVCDVCGELIHQSEGATITWNPDKLKNRYIDKTDFKLFCHLCECEIKEQEYTQEFDVSLMHLLYNTNTHPSKSAEKANLLNKI